MGIKQLAVRVFEFLSTEQKAPRQLGLFTAPKARTKTPPESPALKAKWIALRQAYFPERNDLDHYTVAWSTRRQKRTLGSCALRRKRIVIAKELDDPDYERWLNPLLYHEMCHAVLGESVQYAHGKRAWHGKEFRTLEKRHPDIPAFDMWVKSGGWARAVRRERAKAAHRKRRTHD